MRAASVANSFVNAAADREMLKLKPINEFKLLENSPRSAKLSAEMAAAYNNTRDAMSRIRLTTKEQQQLLQVLRLASARPLSLLVVYRLFLASSIWVICHSVEPTAIRSARKCSTRLLHCSRCPLSSCWLPLRRKRSSTTTDRWSTNAVLRMRRPWCQ